MQINWKLILSHQIQTETSIRTNPNEIEWILIQVDLNQISNLDQSEEIRGRNNSDWKFTLNQPKFSFIRIDF